MGKSRKPATKVTFNVDRELVSQVMAKTGAKTQTEAIEMSLRGALRSEAYKFLAGYVRGAHQAKRRTKAA